MKSLLLAFALVITSVSGYAQNDDLRKDMLTIPVGSYIFISQFFDLEPNSEVTKISYACYFRHKKSVNVVSLAPRTELRVVGTYYNKSNIYHNSKRGIKLEGVDGLEAIECQSDVYYTIWHLKTNLDEIRASLVVLD